MKGTAAEPICELFMRQSRSSRKQRVRTTVRAHTGGGRAAAGAGPGPYDSVIRDVRGLYDVRVKRWRRSMSGCAWRVYKADGSAVNWIESPYPKTPISLAVFLHEIGHHAIGFDRYRRRCEEEYHVWVWAIRQMRRLGVEPDERVRRRFELSVRYAVDKAVRRGIKRLPRVLERYVNDAAA
jgi:hypothetical protein